LGKGLAGVNELAWLTIRDSNFFKHKSRRVARLNDGTIQIITSELIIGINDIVDPMNKPTNGMFSSNIGATQHITTGITMLNKG
jgi:hypothetical protein